MCFLFLFFQLKLSLVAILLHFYFNKWNAVSALAHTQQHITWRSISLPRFFFGFIFIFITSSLPHLVNRYANKYNRKFWNAWIITFVIWCKWCFCVLLDLFYYCFLVKIRQINRNYIYLFFSSQLLKQFVSWAKVIEKCAKFFQNKKKTKKS